MVRKITRLTDLEKLFIEKYPGGKVYRKTQTSYGVVYPDGSKVYTYTADNLPRLAAQLGLITKDEAERMLGWQRFPCGCVGRLDEDHCSTARLSATSWGLP